jgi:putative flavoprotein involved in K+ transport
MRAGRFEVGTDDAVWRAANVVLATGWCDRPAIDHGISHALDSGLHQIAAGDYRNPAALPPGGVLVVGASTTGVQLADELHAAGRDVTIAVGGHTRMPRAYRGMDIYWWLDRLGVLGRTIDQMPDPVLARREPSPQLVGTPDRRPLDLTTLRARGVRLVGRVLAADGHHVRLAPDLTATTRTAELRMRRLLHRIDQHVAESGLRGEVAEPDRPRPLAPTRVVLDLDLRSAGIRTVVWATGHRRAYPWLRLPVLDTRGEIRQRRGRTPVAGLFVLGQRFQHRRDSNFIGGVGRDAAVVADHIAGPSRLTEETSHARP